MNSTKRLMLYKDFVYNDIFYGIAEIIDNFSDKVENIDEEVIDNE